LLGQAPAARILTPHPGEMARMLGIGIAQVQADRIETVRRFCLEHRVYLVLKGARSVLGSPNGPIFVTPTGNPGIATGRSGGVQGVGKSCVPQGSAAGLGVETDVTSPTFVLVNEYQGRLRVYHVDAYRTASLTELVDVGIDEMLHGEGVTVVEWADKLLPLLP